MLSSAEGGIWTLAPLSTTYSLSRGAPSTSWVLLLGWILKIYYISAGISYICLQRRGWDSNPRALADKRFSRPPRYDHFDTSPKVLFYFTEASPFCQGFFSFFQSFCFASQLPTAGIRSNFDSLPFVSADVNHFFHFFRNIFSHYARSTLREPGPARQQPFTAGTQTF